MLDKLREMVQGKVVARVVVVELETGDHACYDLRPGSYVLLETGVSGRLDRLTRSRAVRRALDKTRGHLGDAIEKLDVAAQSNRALEVTLMRQAEILAAVLEAHTLQEAKARAMWAQNPVM